MQVMRYEFLDDVKVELVGSNATDEMVVAAARVSTQGAEAMAAEHAGLINFLLRERHGSPFEHNLFTFKVSAPIFVWREHMRHRVGFSYNEESGRYRELDPVFYIPAADRPLVQVGKPGHYEFEAGSDDLHWLVEDEIKHTSARAFNSYKIMLNLGIAREVARMVLPLNIYSTAFVSCNARSLMHFLGLRTKVEGSHFPSYPQREIEMVAEKYEEIFSVLMPLTYEAFNKHGRVAP